MPLKSEVEPMASPGTAASRLDDPRVKRIARAMCRAARIDPDQPAGTVAISTIMHCHVGRSEKDPAWTLFERQAELLSP